MYCHEVYCLSCIDVSKLTFNKIIDKNGLSWRGYHANWKVKIWWRSIWGCSKLVQVAFGWHKVVWVLESDMLLWLMFLNKLVPSWRDGVWSYGWLTKLVLIDQARVTWSSDDCIGQRQDISFQKPSKKWFVGQLVIESPASRHSFFLCRETTPKLQLTKKISYHKFHPKYTEETKTTHADWTCHICLIKMLICRKNNVN